MHGIVNRGLQLFLIEEYGEDFWRELAVRLDRRVSEGGAPTDF